MQYSCAHYTFNSTSNLAKQYMHYTVQCTFKLSQCHFFNANTPAFNANEVHYRMQRIYRRQRHLLAAINVVLLVESSVESRLNFIIICRNSLCTASIHQGSNNSSNYDNEG